MRRLFRLIFEIIIVFFILWLLLKYTSLFDGMGISLNKKNSIERTQTGVIQKNCTMPRGGSLPDGGQVVAYQSNVVNNINNCIFQTRKCTNGTLDGSYQYQTCATTGSNILISTTGKNCTTPWGQRIPHNSYIIAYQDNHVSSDNCIFERRFCNNGTLGGSYQHNVCKIDGLGTKISWKGSQYYYEVKDVTANRDGSIEIMFTVPENGTISEKNGTTSNNQNANTNAPNTQSSSTNNNTNSNTPNAESTNTNNPNSTANTNSNVSVNIYNTVTQDQQTNTIVHGNTGIVKATSNSSSTSTSSSTSNGNPTTNTTQTTGTITYKNCTTPRGSVVAHGTTITAFNTKSSEKGMTCESQNRTCNNGTLDGTFSYNNCDTQPSSTTKTPTNIVQTTTDSNNNIVIQYTCKTPWGEPLANGQATIAYKQSVVPVPFVCESEIRQCANGVLQGSFQYEGCTSLIDQKTATPSPVSNTIQPSGVECMSPWGEIIPHGSSVISYKEKIITFPSACISESRTCQNGTLGGTYLNQSCNFK